ncbi:unknown protein [Microcystis aeruginosa NIES-843]|uniref:Uncharacterized protein n=1 Tax=Microcystis aeruginosa (strain NIES-843 / IAM M-2473) TaxID=449447 RepID=B0JQ97_MICAN|nr:unknown protein [Microcystis aeruginosa NIES-843]
MGRTHNLINLVNSTRIIAFSRCRINPQGESPWLGKLREQNSGCAKSRLIL